MIQDIYPSRLDNSFTHCTPEPDDVMFVFDKEGNMAMLLQIDRQTGRQTRYPSKEKPTKKRNTFRIRFAKCGYYVILFEINFLHFIAIFWPPRALM